MELLNRLIIQNINSMKTKEEIAAYKKEWNKKNREASNARKKLWYEENKQRANENAKEWAARNPEKRKAIAKKSHEKHKEKREAYIKEWRAKNPDHWRKSQAKTLSELGITIQQLHDYGKRFLMENPEVLATLHLINNEQKTIDEVRKIEKKENAKRIGKKYRENHKEEIRERNRKYKEKLKNEKKIKTGTEKKNS